MAEAQSWDELVQQSAPKKPAGPASWDDLVAESAKDPGYLGEIGRGLKAGAQVQLPKMAGQALKFFGAEETGDSLIAGAEARNTPDLQESATGQAHDSPFSVRGSVYEAASNAVPSLAPGAAGAAVGAAVGSVVPGLGTAAGALLGYAAGSIASLPMFYGSQAQESYEAVKKTQLEAGKSEAEADSIAKRTAHAEGAIEAGGELAADVIPFAKLFKPLARPAGKAAGSLVKDTLFPTFRQGLQTTAQTVGGEVATEMGQQAGEDYVRKSMGDTGPGATWDETAKVIMPTALMSLIPGAGGAAAVHLQRKGAVATLINPEADPETRSKVALGVAGALEPVDPSLSRAFAGYAAEQIKAGQPIEIGPDALYTAKAQPVLALPSPVVAWQAGESIEAQSARQAAIDQAETNAAKVYAERAEVEATQRVLGAGTIDEAIQSADQGAAFEADIADSVSLRLVHNQIGKAVTTAGRLADEQAARDRDFDAMQAARRDAEAQAAIAESERRDGDGPAKTAMQIAFEKATLKALEARERAKEIGNAIPEQVAGTVDVRQQAGNGEALGVGNAQPEGAAGAQGATQGADRQAPEVKLFGRPVAELSDQELAAAAQNHPMSGFRHAAETERARRAALAPMVVPAQETAAPVVASAAPAQPQTVGAPPQATPSTVATAAPPALAAPVEPPSTPPQALPTAPQQPLKFLGKPLGDVTTKLLAIAAKKARSKAVRDGAAAEIERRADEKQARPLSPAEETRRASLRQQAAQRKRIDVDRDSLVHAAIKLGGISPKERQDITGDTKGDNPAVMGVGYLFSSTGTGTDDMATRLGQYGYLSQAELDDVDGGVQALKDKIADELRGARQHWSTSGQAYEREAAARAAAEDAETLERERPVSWDTMTEEQKDEHLDAIFGADSRERQAAGGQETRQGAPAQEVGSAEQAVGEREPGQDDEEVARPALALSAQTEADLKAKEKQAATGTAEERAAAVRDRNEAILTPPEGTAPARDVAEQKVPVQQPNLFGSAVAALRTAAAELEKASKPVEPPPSKPSERIGDFGEKIGGARKDVWQTFKDRLKEAEGVDIAAEPLSKSWPEPDYQALLDAGADPWAVAFMHAARDAIPPKPRASWKTERWADLTRTLRDLTMKLADGTASIGQQSVMGTISKMSAGSREIAEIGGRIDLYQLVGHSKSLAGVRVSSGQYGIFEGKEYNPPKVIWTVEKKATASAMSNWPRMLAQGATKAEALQDFKTKFSALQISEPAAKETTFEIFSKRGENGYWVGKKIGRNPTLLDGPFKTVKEARAYKDENHDKLVSKLEKVKEIPSLRRDTNEPRIGEDMRNGQDVTPQMFGETFGFRGVEFGNWVEQGKRQKDLNDAFDALMDMAAVLNVSPKALSLNGELGLAFGARGTGGVEAAKAHYESGHVVINLTKKEGAGSLGHEWWHALDNYFSRMRGKRTDYLTEGLDVSLAARGSQYHHAGEVRKEMIDAFGQVVRAIRETALKARSSKLDAKRSKDYWTTGREMAARAYESYLISKLQDQNASNDYLANIVDEKTWKAAESLGWEIEDSYPYPTAGEVPKIRAAFDAFFQAVQTKETDKGVAMFSRQADNIGAYKLHRGEDKNGQPAFANGEIIIARGRPDPISRGEGVRSYQWTLYDRTKPGEKGGRYLKIGELYGDLTADGKFEMLRSITIYNRFQGSGYGESVVASMLAHNGPGYRMGVENIQHHTSREEDNALPFWQKLGTRLHNYATDPNVEINGDLALADYLRAREGKGTFFRDGQAQAAENQPTGRQEGPGGNARAREAGAADRAGREGVPGRPDGAPEAVEDARAYRRAPGRYETLAPEDIRRLIAPILKNWGNAPEVKVISSITEAPEAVKRMDSAQREGGATGEPEAFINAGTVYLVANGLSSEAAVVRALFHESFGHYGLKGVLGDRIVTVLNEVVKSAPKRVEAKAKEYGLNWENADAKLIAAEEVLAEIAQSRPTLGLVRRAVAIVRQFLRDLGINVALSENDIIHQFILPARRFVTEQRQGWTGTASSAFSRAPAAAAAPTYSVPSWAEGFDAAKKDALRKAGVIFHQDTLKDRARSLTKDFGKTFVQGVVDQFAPLKDLDPIAYMKARLSRATDGGVEALLMYGKPFLRDGAIDVDARNGGFLKVLQGLKNEHDRFFAWVAGMRAGELKAKGKENLLTDEDLSFLRTLDRSDASWNGRQEAYAAALRQLQAYNKAVLDIAEKQGIIDGESRPLWESQFYVPFYRAMEDGVAGPTVKSGLVRQYAFKKLKGGTQDLNDLTKNTLMNWSHLLSASQKNAAAKAAIDAAVRVGVAVEADEESARQMGKSIGNKRGVVNYLESGAQRWFVVDDPHILDAITSLEFAGFGPWMKPMAAFKRWLTFGVTANPAFKIRNLIRDSLAAIGQNPVSYNVFKNIAQGWKATEHSSQTRASLMAGGGMFRFGTILEGDRAQHLKELIESGVSEDTVLDTADKVKAFFRKTWDKYQEFGDRSENINRAALYEQLIKQGKDHLEASYLARDMLDFSMSGKWAAIRFLTQSVPFMNARLQGLYKLGRAVKEDPARAGYVTGAIALASLALLIGNEDDDDWKKREDWDRDTYWWFKFGGVAFRIPKPFELGAIGTIVERTYELAFNKEMSGKRYGQRMADILSQNFSMSPVPQLVKPLVDLYANQDSFSGRPIETMGMERLRKQDRYSEHTTYAARAIGMLGIPDPLQLMQGRYEGISPAQADFLIRGYFGWMGTMTSTAADYGIRPIAGAPEKPSMQLRDVFLAGNFVESLPTGSSRYVTDFYNQAKEIEQAYGSYREALKQGDVAKARDIFEAEREKIAKYKSVEAVKRIESQITSKIHRIEDSNASAQDKRRLIDMLERQKDLAARRITAVH